MKAILKIRRGPGTGLRYDLPEGATLRLGRAPENDIALDAAAISRIHCVFRNEGGVCTVKDMGGVNGTRVNGELVRDAVELNPGDQIVIGKKTLIRFLRVAGPPADGAETQSLREPDRKRPPTDDEPAEKKPASPEPVVADADDESSSFVVAIQVGPEAKPKRKAGLLGRLFARAEPEAEEGDSSLLRLFIRQWQQGNLYAVRPDGTRIPFQDMMERLTKPKLMSLDIRDGGLRGIQIKFSAPVPEMALEMGPDGRPATRKVVEADALRRILPPGDRAKLKSSGPFEVVEDEGLEENPAVREALEKHHRLSITVEGREMYLNLTRQEFAKFANIPRCHRYELAPIQEPT